MALQVLECRALAGNADFLGPLLPGPRFGTRHLGAAVAQAVCIMDAPLQEGESQVCAHVKGFLGLGLSHHEHGNAC